MDRADVAFRDAWNNLKGKPKEDCMKEYVELYLQVCVPFCTSKVTNLVQVLEPHKGILQMDASASQLTLSRRRRGRQRDRAGEQCLSVGACACSSSVICVDGAALGILTPVEVVVIVRE